MVREQVFLGSAKEQAGLGAGLERSLGNKEKAAQREICRLDEEYRAREKSRLGNSR